jgi:WD40 repeat protein
VALSSLKCALDRISSEQLLVEDAAYGGGAADESRMVLQDAARLTCVSSQVGSKRPIQGVALSPDSGTLATADWNGVVTFWAPEENIRLLKNLQVFGCLSFCFATRVAQQLCVLIPRSALLHDSGSCATEYSNGLMTFRTPEDSI